MRDHRRWPLTRGGIRRVVVGKTVLDLLLQGFGVVGIESTGNSGRPGSAGRDAAWHTIHGECLPRADPGQAINRAASSRGQFRVGLAACGQFLGR